MSFFNWCCSGVSSETATVVDLGPAAIAAGAENSATTEVVEPTLLQDSKSSSSPAASPTSLVADKEEQQHLSSKERGRPPPLELGDATRWPKELKETAPALAPKAEEAVKEEAKPAEMPEPVAAAEETVPQQVSPTESRVSVTKASAGLRLSIQGKKLGPPFPERPARCPLGSHLWTKVSEVFVAMALPATNTIAKEEAVYYFKDGFAQMSADAMFNQVDIDGNGIITSLEFVDFWLSVKAAGYSDADILAELESLSNGSVWVDFNDGRNTDSGKHKAFPKRPFFHALSGQAWNKCQDLFCKMDGDGQLVVTREKAENFFGGGFGKVSANAMFNEVDSDGWGTITADKWMSFWKQVKHSGYKEKEIVEELSQLLNGGAWVDWRDGRSTDHASNLKH